MLHKAPLVEALCEALSAVTSKQTGRSWSGHVLPAQPELEEASSTRSALALVLDGSLSGELYVVPDANVSRATFPDTGSGSDDRFAAWLSMCEAQSAEITEQLSSRQPGLVLTACRLVTLGPGATPVAAIEASIEGTTSGVIHLLADRALVVHLKNPHEPSVPEVPSTTAEATPPRLERVIDVPLAVSLRFGQRQLTLRELLELNTGALLELDRQVEEPVDLVLGERVIARGEVVIVDGNYGLRVTEVIEPAPHKLFAHV